MQVTFIDLFAGIGGIRYAFEAAGAECVFSCEINHFARAAYYAFHGDMPYGDINSIPIESIPRHNILTAGFPCQPFSIAGVSGRNSLGIAHGFDDPTHGTLFFNIKEILIKLQPEAFLLENVKHIIGHDKGNTFRIIQESLSDAGYNYSWRVIDSAGWVPQHRERVYIVGFRKDLPFSEMCANCFPSPPSERPSLSSILESPEEIERKYGDRYTLGLKTWEALKRHKQRHMSAGNGFGYSLLVPPFDETTVTRTLPSRYHKDGSEILIAQEPPKRPRKLTPLEACRLQGFPKSCEMFFDGTFKQPVSDRQSYIQFGNAVTVPVVTDIARLIVDELLGNLAYNILRA